MNQKINSFALGYSIASLCALLMLFLGILGKLGIYLNAVTAMSQWLLFFSLSFFGIVAGIVEGAITGFILGYLVGFFYNKFN